MTTRVLFPCLLLVCATGCGDPALRWPHPLTPLGELPWPASAAAPDSCIPAPTAFAEPDLPPPSGKLRIDSPVRLWPTGLVSTLDILAVTDAGVLDHTASGEVRIALSGAGEVLSTTPLRAGRAEARVRLDKAGRFTVTLNAGRRTGTTVLVAYDSRVSVWELTADEARLEALNATPHENQRVAGRIAIDGVEFPTAVRLHGGTSRDYPKKSYRFDLAEGQRAGGRGHLILRAEWNDKTMLRNWLAHEVFRLGTWLPTPQTRFVHFRVNGRFRGLMLQVERIDRDFLAARGLDPTGDLYEADPPLGGPFGNLTPLPPDQYAEVYDHHAGAADHANLRRLVEEVLVLAPAAFATALPQEVAIDDLLVYLAAMALVQNQDHVRKNFYLYRSKAVPRGWVVLPWDLDLTFGHLWSVGEDVLGEGMTFDGDPFVGASTDGRGLYNVLIERVLAYPELRARMLAMAQRLASTVMTPAVMDARLDAVVCYAMPELLADTRKRATNAEYLARVDEVRQFIAERGARLQAMR